MDIRQFVDEGLGDSAHLVVSARAGVAALIDPLRDVDRYLDAAAAAGVRITHVFETHLHNDFLSGGRELASRTGARLVASAAAGLRFEHEAVVDGDAFVVGDVRIGVLETPGHTPEHVSFLARDGAAPEAPPVLFSGGSLLVGTVARTDLLGRQHAAGLARQLYRSLHDKLLRLPDDTPVYPTHGAGSFCTAAPGAARNTTLGHERRTNPLLQLEGPEAFVEATQRGLPSYPAYYRHLRPINQRGPRLLGRLPTLAPLAPQEVHDRLARGEAVVDLRQAARYAAGHIPGAYHVALRPQFGVWVGWVVPFGTPVTLVADSTAVLEEAARQLVRIGYDALPGYLEGGMGAWEGAGLPVVRTTVLRMGAVRERLERGEPLVVLDVRQAAEWGEGHLPQAHHVEAGALATAALPYPSKTPIAAHCGHGQRSATAVSLLERRGYRNLSLITEGVEDWEEAGGALARGDAR